MLSASENKLLDIPNSIEKLENLKVLKLQSNDIAVLPVGIGDLLSLNDIDLSNNARLVMIPKQLRGDTAMVLWLCQMFSSARSCYSICQRKRVAHDAFVIARPSARKSRIAEIELQSHATNNESGVKIGK